MYNSIGLVCRRKVSYNRDRGKGLFMVRREKRNNYIFAGQEVGQEGKKEGKGEI